MQPKLLGMRADLLSTTSPSVLIFAGLDGWRRQMALGGQELMGGALELAADVRAAIEKIDGMHVNDRDDFCGPGRAHGFDPLPVVVDLDGLGVSGFRAADWLREHRGVIAHITDHRRIGAQITHGDDRDTADELLTALKDLARAAPGLSPLRASRCRPRRSCGCRRCACPGTRSSVPPRTCPSTGRPAGSRRR